MTTNLSVNEEVKLDQGVNKDIAEMNVFAGEEEDSYAIIYDERGKWKYSVSTDWF
jgi:hypothetical protein